MRATKVIAYVNKRRKLLISASFLLLYSEDRGPGREKGSKQEGERGEERERERQTEREEEFDTPSDFKPIKA